MKIENIDESRLRVLLVSKFYPPSSLARAIQIDKVVGAMRDQGIEVKVIAGILMDTNETGESYISVPDVSYVPYGKKVACPQRNILARIYNRGLQEISFLNPVDTWVTRAAKLALATSLDFKPHILMTSSTPFDSHAVGISINSKLEIPWLASFSDPWPPSLMPYPYNLHRLPVLEFFRLRSLRKVADSCSAMHFTSPYAIECFTSPLKAIVQKKYFSISHVGTKINSTGRAVVPGLISHVGDLTRERVSIELIRGIKIASKASSKLRKIRFIGNVCTEFIEMIDSFQLKKVIELIPRVSHVNAMKLIDESEALLLIEADMPFSPFFPSKFSDYAQTGKPIVAITPRRSQVAELMQKYCGGISCEMNSEAISNGFTDIFDTPISREYLKLAQLFSADSIGNDYKHHLLRMLPCSKGL